MSVNLYAKRMDGEYLVIREHYNRFIKNLEANLEDVNRPVSYKINTIDEDTNEYRIIILGQPVKMKLLFVNEQKFCSWGLIGFYLSDDKNTLLYSAKLNDDGCLNPQIGNSYVGNFDNPAGECGSNRAVNRILSEVALKLAEKIKQQNNL